MKIKYQSTFNFIRTFIETIYMLPLSPLPPANNFTSDIVLVEMPPVTTF